MLGIASRRISARRSSAASAIASCSAIWPSMLGGLFCRLCGACHVGSNSCRRPVNSRARAAAMAARASWAGVPSLRPERGRRLAGCGPSGLGPKVYWPPSRWPPGMRAGRGISMRGCVAFESELVRCGLDLVASRHRTIAHRGAFLVGGEEVALSMRVKITSRSMLRASMTSRSEPYLPECSLMRSISLSRRCERLRAL